MNACYSPLVWMLVRQHQLQKELACLENQHERMKHQLQDAINHLDGIRGTEMTEVPSEEDVRSIVVSILETRDALGRLANRISAC